MVMRRGVYLIVFFSVHSLTAFTISTVVFTIQLSLIGEGLRKGILLCLEEREWGTYWDLEGKDNGETQLGHKSGIHAPRNGTQEKLWPEARDGNWIIHGKRYKVSGEEG